MENLIIKSIYVASFFLYGVMSYFFAFGGALWIPYIIILLCGIYLLINIKTLFFKNDAIIYSLIFYFFSYVISLLTGEERFFVSILAAKNYLLVWVLFFYLINDNGDKNNLTWIFYFLIIIALAQMPLAIVQRIFFAFRDGSLNWDGIVGTFGGAPDAGGYSGAMAIFLLYSTLVFVSLFAHKLISFGVLVVCCFIMFIPIALGEVKIIFIMLPLAIIMYFYYTKKLSIKNLLFVAIVGVVFLYIMQEIYSNMYYAEGVTDEKVSFSGMFGYEEDFYWQNDITGEVSRLGALLRWWLDNSFWSLLLGHGPGSSKISEVFGAGVAASKVSYLINGSTASIILWENGVVGFFLFMLVIYFGLKSTRDFMLTESKDVVSSIIAGPLSVWFSIQFVLVFYNNDLIDHVTSQVLFATNLAIAYRLKNVRTNF